MFAQDFLTQIAELEAAEQRLREARIDVAGRTYNLTRDVVEQVYRGNLTPDVLKLDVRALKRAMR